MNWEYRRTHFEWIEGKSHFPKEKWKYNTRRLSSKNSESWNLEAGGAWEPSIQAFQVPGGEWLIQSPSSQSCSCQTETSSKFWVKGTWAFFPGRGRSWDQPCYGKVCTKTSKGEVEWRHADAGVGMVLPPCKQGCWCPHSLCSCWGIPPWLRSSSYPNTQNSQEWGPSMLQRVCFLLHPEHCPNPCGPSLLLLKTSVSKR